MEPAPGSAKSLSPVEENAAFSRELSKMKVDESTRQPGVTDTLVSNVARYSASYELERGFKGSSSRVCISGPRVTLFGSDAPFSSTTPARLICELSQARSVAPQLAVQGYRIFGPCPDADELRGSLYSRGSVFQFADRAQALPQLLASARSLPTAPQKDKAMWTEALPMATSVCQKQMIQGCVAKPSREMQIASAPWECNAVLDNAVGSLAFAIILNVKGQKATRLRPRIAGTAIGVGEPHFAFTSDCLGCSARATQLTAMIAMVPVPS